MFKINDKVKLVKIISYENISMILCTHINRIGVITNIRIYGTYNYTVMFDDGYFNYFNEKEIVLASSIDYYDEW